MSNEHKIEIKGAEIVEAGGGKVTLMLDGDLVAEIPCNAEAQRWAGGRLYKHIDVEITIKASAFAEAEERVEKFNANMDEREKAIRGIGRA